MQSVSSRTWTRVTVSISCEDNHYTTGTSTLQVIIWFQVFLSNTNNMNGIIRYNFVYSSREIQTS